MIALPKCVSRLLLFISLISVFAVPVASFAEDAGGTWQFDYGYQMTFTSGASFTGTGGPYNGYTWNITNGNISGNNITWQESYDQIAYVVQRTGTINGDTMSGTWVANGSQNGSFVANRISGGSGGNNNNNNNGSKRATATTIFCNRNGVGLSNADCHVTVADAGAPPRSAPTGVIDLVATNGFFPAKAQCFPQQTQYSPGIVSCKVQFAIPNGFPIGIAFPIDATYMGDTVFEGSSTSHATIQAGCIGDATSPCSGAVALTFADIPQILKNAISTVFECGSSKSASQVYVRGPFGDIGKCVGKITADIKLGEILSKMDLSQLNSIGSILTKADGSTSDLLKAMGAFDETKYQSRLQQAVGDQQKLTELVNQILKDQHKINIDTINNIRSARASRRPITVVLGTADISVKDNSIKPLKIKLNKPAAKLIKALKKAGKGDVNVNMTLKGKRAKGPKKPFNKSFSVTTGLN